MALFKELRPLLTAQLVLIVALWHLLFSAEFWFWVVCPHLDRNSSWSKPPSSVCHLPLPLTVCIMCAPCAAHREAGGSCLSQLRGCSHGGGDPYFPPLLLIHVSVLQQNSPSAVISLTSSLVFLCLVHLSIPLSLSLDHSSFVSRATEDNEAITPLQFFLNFCWRTLFHRNSYTLRQEF